MTIGSNSKVAADLGPVEADPASVLGFVGDGLAVADEVDGGGMLDLTVLGFFKPVEGLVSVAGGAVFFESLAT